MVPKRKRGRPARTKQEPPHLCPWCARLARLNPNTKRLYCQCGWME